MSALPNMPLPARPRITGRRAMPRVRLYIPAQVMLLNGMQNCLLDDLSQTGARVTLAGRMPQPGSGVVLKAKGLDVFGTVVWSEGARFGILFDEPLPLHDVVNVRHFADAWTEHEAAQARRNARMFVQGRPRLRPYS
jgi:hypothetical protein